ncbi:YkvA family protein [Pseudochrobactrum sp. HB0163]|uniref:YkvA family protein n=1 Tax=Pseudochrobactrum sp. HB0163 TaxID=3450708 RepID=UPI003F6E182F
MDNAKIRHILQPGSERTQQSRAQYVRKKFWKTLKKAAGNIPFTEELVASYYCALDPQTPRRARAILLAALAYFVLPFDFVPDLLVGIGFTDDVAVLMAALAAIRNHITPAHFAAARNALRQDPESESDIKPDIA